MAAGVRQATGADIPFLIDLTERLARSVEGPQRVDRLHTGQTLAGLISDPSGIVLVSRAGFIAGAMMRTVISPDPVAFELGWYAEDRSGIALLRGFEAWAQQQGASLIKMSCAGGTVQQLLQRCGYRVAEIQMVK